jgi:hypothetical protein
VEDSILFHKNLHEVQIFVKQEKKYHAAAGESGHYGAQTPSLQIHRATRVTVGMSDRDYTIFASLR